MKPYEIENTHRTQGCPHTKYQPLPPPLLASLGRLEGGRKISSEIEAHEGPVYALYAYPAPDGSGTCVVSGGADGKVKTWDAEVREGRG